MAIQNAEIDVINNARADLAEVINRLPKQYADTLCDIVDELSDLVEDLKG